MAKRKKLTHTDNAVITATLEKLTHDQRQRRADNTVIAAMLESAIKHAQQTIDELSNIINDKRLVSRLQDHEHANMSDVLRHLHDHIKYLRERNRTRIKPQGARSRVILDRKER